MKKPTRPEIITVLRELSEMLEESYAVGGIGGEVTNEKVKREILCLDAAVELIGERTPMPKTAVRNPNPKNPHMRFS